MPQNDDPAAPGATKRQRIAKLMARAGLCSRRDAEAWIVDGRVSVNGIVLTSPALDVAPEDAILVDGAPIPAADKTRLFLFHKPRGLVTSDHDPEGRTTVADFLRENWPDGPRVVTIGRLDINTEGLLLLTNDGGLARLLELPQTGWVRRYRVRAKGTTDPATLDALAAGVTIDGIDYVGIEAKLDRIQGANCWLTMGLREGKNREIKRVLEHIGLEVNRLIRLSFGPFQMLDLPEGAVEEVRTRVLRDQLGETLAARAGVDFGEPAAVAAAPAEKTLREPRRDERAERAKPAGRDRKAQTRPDRAPPGRSFRPPQRDSGDETRPPRERPIAGTRKHVSTLRADETAATRQGPRKRIERTDTRDRHERAVKVERLVSTRPAPAETRARPPRTRPDKSPSPHRSAGPRDNRSDARRGGETPNRRRDDRPKRDDRPRHSDKPRYGEERPEPRGHASPSALGKRERMARSGAAPDRVREHRSGRDHEDGRGAGAGKVRSTRPADGDGAVRGARGERAQVPRPGAERRGRQPTDGQGRHARSDRNEGRRPDRGDAVEKNARPRNAGERHGAARDKTPGSKSRESGRPMGAASRKPGHRARPGEGASRAGSPKRDGTPARPRTPGRAGPPRGRPPRGPKR